MTPAKNNLGDDKSGYGFRVESCRLPSGIDTSRVTWEADAVTIAPDEALEQSGSGEERSGLGKAKSFLQDLLAKGPISTKEIEKDADGKGFAWGTIRRARKALRVEAVREGYGKDGVWKWRLPSKVLKESKDACARSLSTYGRDEHLCDEVIVRSGQTPTDSDHDCDAVAEVAGGTL